jgi:hemin uptake protein HemP
MAAPTPVVPAVAEASPAPTLTSTPAPSASQPSPQRIDSTRLFGAAAELLIDHHGVVYRLKRTALGKLILTK